MKLERERVRSLTIRTLGALAGAGAIASTPVIYDLVQEEQYIEATQTAISTGVIGLFSAALFIEPAARKKRKQLLGESLSLTTELKEKTSELGEVINKRRSILDELTKK